MKKSDIRYVFIAGGVGITPFRSIVKEHILQKKTLPAVLFYCVASEEDLLFTDVFEEAKRFGLVYLPIIRNKKETFTKELLTKILTNHRAPHYYISGSSLFISNIQEVLLKAAIEEERIKTDIFSGYTT